MNKKKVKLWSKGFYFNLEIYEKDSPEKQVKFKNIPLSLIDEAIDSVKRKYR